MEENFIDLKAKECQCKYCRYWIGFVTGQGESLSNGECRRFPPTETKMDEGGLWVGIWPITQETDNCGEFLRYS